VANNFFALRVRHIWIIPFDFSIIW